MCFYETGVIPGRLKHELCVVLDEKARAYVKLLNLTNKKARAFPGQKHMLAYAFWSKYDQNYGVTRAPLTLGTAPYFYGSILL